ncbi:hypothetical protein [Rhodanobacter sp. UC4436_H3]
MSFFEEVGAGNTSPLEKLEQALQKKAVGGKQKKEADFAEAYPVMEQHLGRKVPVKVVMEMFGEAYGYVIHPPRFRQMLEAERKRRAEAGDWVTCAGCGQRLPAASMAVGNMGGTEEQSHVE